MGLADLRPLPIPLLVRYELIDSRARARAHVSVRSVGWLLHCRKAREERKNAERMNKREKRGTRIESTEREREREREREKRHYIAPERN